MDRTEKDSEKERIRNRYKGVSPDLLETIPAIEHVDILRDDSEKRVGVYARVSTDDSSQTSSFELQRNHYTDLIERYPNWHLYKIYADEGISGTSLKKRKAFLEMIEDCKQHKLDLIVTKSVSRFARNIFHCIGYIRELAALKPPVGVYFETEGLYTLRDNNEMALSFTATFAQEESRTRSSAMNLSYEMRFRRGIFMLPKLLGYDKDEEGNLVVNEDEALTVRLIFFMFLYGYTPQKIAETLTELKRTTKKGNQVWTASSVLGILQNERHCGDVLAHKTWTPNYLDHKAVKNFGDKPQYRQRDHHEAIISHDDFVAAQQLIAHSVTGRTGMLPHLHVIENGALEGFVIVNPRWTGFSAQDYLAASKSTIKATEQPQSTPSILKPENGAVDLRGYSVVRGQFFESRKSCSLHLSHEQLWFNKHGLNNFPEQRYVEFLLDSVRCLLAVRIAHRGEKNAVEWCYFDGKTYKPRHIIGRAYLPVFYEIMGWQSERDYIVQGECLGNGTDSILVFDLNDAEALIQETVKFSSDGEDDQKAVKSETTQQIIAMPTAWIESFGSEYYSEGVLMPTQEALWNPQDKGTPLPRNDPFHATSQMELKNQIKSIISEIKDGSSYG